MKRILGIFTCFNRREKTLKCLASLQSQNESLDFRFLAVDDNSRDGTAKALEAWPEVTVIHGSGNLYYTGGMRVGIQRAKELGEAYDYVLLFNDDVEFYPHAVERLADLAESEGPIDAGKKNGTILVGAACDRKGNLSYGGIKKKSRFRPSFQIMMGGQGREFCDTFNANCVLIPWNIFRTGPDMDGHYRHSLGDFAYGLQLREQGNVIAVSDFFVGICEDNPPDGTWRDPHLSRRERLRLKEQPKGLPAGEWFYFIRNYFGFFSACVYTAVPYIKIMLGRPT